MSLTTIPRRSRSAQVLALLACISLVICLNFAPPNHAQSTTTLDTEELAFLQLINDYRAQNGAGPLQASVTLTNASKWMSADIGAKNYFSHTDSLGRDPFARMAAFGYTYNTFKGENIAAGNATAQATFTQWKNSPDHNQNMLNPNFKAIGIGRVSTPGSTYNWYWTTKFGGFVDQTIPTNPTPTPSAGNDTVWVEDAVPAGSILGGDGEGWNWIATNPAPSSGNLAHQSALVAGQHQHYFFGASSTLAVGVGESLFAYIYLDPANPPSQVMLQWNDGSWEHRAYWGANQINWGSPGTASRRYIGPLPAAGQWVRLQVPASQVGLEGRILNGMAFTLYNGRATFDRAGKSR